jgi:hypothetical protein
VFSGCKYKLHQSGSPDNTLHNINIANTLTGINDLTFRPYGLKLACPDCPLLLKYSHLDCLISIDFSIYEVLACICALKLGEVKEI